MGYPEKLLADDERVVEHLHPHWITLLPATLWFIVICAAAGVGIGFAPDSGHMIYVIAIVVVGFALLCWLTFGPWLGWRTTHYVFTTHRVMIRRGILKHTGRDIALQRINDVGFSQTLFERIVGAGTLTIESAGEHGQETLHNIPHSDQTQQQLNRLVEEDGDRRAAQAYGAGMAQQGYGPGAHPGGPGAQGYPPAGPGGTSQYPPDYPPRYPSSQQYPRR